LLVYTEARRGVRSLCRHLCGPVGQSPAPTGRLLRRGVSELRRRQRIIGPTDGIEQFFPVGGNADELWECLYLREPEVANFLDFVQERKAPAWVYPMCVMAAHTGARRSEMLRAEQQDVDFKEGIITIREKKRVRGKVTTRRVLSSRLKESLAALPLVNGHLFGNLSEQSAQKAFMRIVGKHMSGAKRGEAPHEGARQPTWKHEKNRKNRRFSWGLMGMIYLLMYYDAENAII